MTPSTTTTYASQVGAGVLDWLESVRFKDEGWGRWKYHGSMERPYGLQCSGMAIQILHRLDALQNVSAAQKAEAVAWIQNCQDTNDGYFKDPLVRESDHRGTHSWEEIWNQASSVIGAMKLIGGEPLHPLPAKRFVNLANVDVRDWVLHFDWSNSWRHSEIVSRCINAYADNLPPGTDFSTEPIVQRAFAIYESELLDPTVGMPIKRGANLPNAMCGLFKIMTSYVHLRRPVPHAERAVDATLSLQNEEGEIGARRNMCMNYDALWNLYHLDKQLEGAYRRDDIRRAGNLLADCLLNVYRKPDGGFSFLGDKCQPNHHSVYLGPSLPIGDMLGTKFALESLKFSDGWNALHPNDKPTPEEARRVSATASF